MVKSGSKTNAWIDSIVNNVFHNKTGAILVARENNVVIGCTVCHDGTLPYDNDLGKIAVGMGTYVDAKFRGCGVSSMLYEKMKMFLSSLGYTTYMGARLVGNKKAEYATTSAGFVPVELSLVARLEKYWQLQRSWRLLVPFWEEPGLP